MLCLKTSACLAHRYYERFYLPNNWQSPWQATLLCLAVTRVPFGWCNSALGMAGFVPLDFFYAWCSEHRVASVGSPLDHRFSSQHTPVGCRCLARADYFKLPGIVPGSHFFHTKSMKCSWLQYSFTIVVISNCLCFILRVFLICAFIAGREKSSMSWSFLWWDSTYTKALKDITTALFC